MQSLIHPLGHRIVLAKPEHRRYEIVFEAPSEEAPQVFLAFRAGNVVLAGRYLKEQPPKMLLQTSLTSGRRDELTSLGDLVDVHHKKGHVSIAEELAKLLHQSGYPYVLAASPEAARERIEMRYADKRNPNVLLPIPAPR